MNNTDSPKSMLKIRGSPTLNMGKNKVRTKL